MKEKLKIMKWPSLFRYILGDLKIACLSLLLAASVSGATAASSEITEITLERTPCFGTCPVYEVTLRSDGTVVYEGKRFTKEIGRRTGKISTKQFQELATKIEQIGFFALNDEYLTKKNADGSETRVTDLPSRITTVKRGAESKRIRNYFGGPESLKELEELIDRISNSGIWVGKK